MTTRRRFLETVGGGLTGSWLARALPLGGVLGWPGVARAASSLVTECMRLDTNDVSGWQQLGNQPPSTSTTAVQFSDSSNSDVCGIYQPNACAAPGLEVDVVARFQVRSTTPNNATDSGFRIVINDGLTKSAIVACVLLDGHRVLALAGPGSAHDPATYLVSIPVDWIATVRLRLRRAVDGGAELIEVNGVAPNPRVFLRADQSAQKSRTGATFEIGCLSPEALADADVTVFYAETPATQTMGELAFTEFRIRDEGSADRLRFRADFSMGAGSDGIDPSTEIVSVRLSTTAGPFYPSPAADFNPLSGFGVRGQAPRRRWSLNDSERTRTGIERLHFDENPSQTGAIVLQDIRTTLPDIDYSIVYVEVEVGDDLLTGMVNLVEKRPGSGQWRLDG